MNLADMNYIEILKNKVMELEKENKELKDLSAELESECILKDMRVGELKAENKKIEERTIVDKECIKKLEGKLIKKDNEIIRLNKQIAQLETMYDENLKEVLEL